MTFLEIVMQILAMSAGIALAWALFDWMPNRAQRRRLQLMHEQALARRNASIEKDMQESVARHQAMQLRALDQRNTEWFKQGASGD